MLIYWDWMNYGTKQQNIKNNMTTYRFIGDEILPLEIPDDEILKIIPIEHKPGRVILWIKDNNSEWWPDWSEEFKCHYFEEFFFITKNAAIEDRIEYRQTEIEMYKKRIIDNGKEIDRLNSMKD